MKVPKVQASLYKRVETLDEIWRFRQFRVGSEQKSANRSIDAGLLFANQTLGWWQMRNVVVVR